MVEKLWASANKAKTIGKSYVHELLKKFLNARKYKNPHYVEYMAKKAVEGSRTKKYFVYDVKGEYGMVEFTCNCKSGCLPVLRDYIFIYILRNIEEK
ncbi:MAG: hypothetical protein QMD22_02335 [archaeon]|nr:hypothetical protein [archaeon]